MKYKYRMVPVNTLMSGWQGEFVFHEKTGQPIGIFCEHCGHNIMRLDWMAMGVLTLKCMLCQNTHTGYSDCMYYLTDKHTALDRLKRMMGLIPESPE